MRAKSLIHQGEIAERCLMDWDPDFYLQFSARGEVPGIIRNPVSTPAQKETPEPPPRVRSTPKRRLLEASTNGGWPMHNLMKRPREEEE